MLKLWGCQLPDKGNPYTALADECVVAKAALKNLVKILYHRENSAETVQHF
ncbi:MAG: hypothetical protein V7K48_01560 [Nostoc sp.]|uniref:hypothetical protein n=1 Tax=Nostoc sp. TaxID=1180 RepID=UPI002FFB7097